jgi:hypothetical protein
MRIRRLLGSSLGVAAAMLGAAASAQSSGIEDVRGAWMLGLGAEVDEDDSDSLLATLYLGIGRKTWLTFIAGQSKSPADLANIEADTLAVAVDHRFEHVGFTFEVERWGDSGALETEDLTASIYVDRGRWRAELGYETRDIDIPFTVTGPLGRTFERTAESSGDALFFNARVALAERWQLYLGLAEHDYENNLQLLPRIESLNLLSTSTLTLANSFLDHERYVALEREFGRTSSVNVRYATDGSAVDDSKYETLEAAVLFPIGRRVDLEVNVGSGRSDFFDVGAYAGLVFLVYGR